MTDIAYGVYTSNIQCNIMNSNKEAHVNKGDFLTVLQSLNFVPRKEGKPFPVAARVEPAGGVQDFTQAPRVGCGCQQGR